MLDNVNDNLFLEALVVGLLAFLIVRRNLSWASAVIVVAIRLGIPLIYFTCYDTDPWRLNDDQGYFHDGLEVLDQGYNPLTALFTPDGVELLQGLAGGHHILYTWWNVTAMYLFGEHYFAPVLLNVLITFGTSAILHRTTAVLGFPPVYSTALQVFYLLHWDVIAWSSFMNLKDSIVQFLTVTVLYFASRFFRYHDRYSVVAFVAVLPVFYLIRFYVPLLVLLTSFTWMLFQWKDNLKYFLVPLVLVVAYLARPLLEGALGFLKPEEILFGAVRLLLTPLPWRVAEEYSFLEISSVLHLLFFLPTMIGFLSLWLSNRPARLYLIYFCIVVALYAITEELQGPRHRFQIAFIFAWAQFHFLWILKPATEPQARPLVMNTALARQPLRRPMQPAMTATYCVSQSRVGARGPGATRLAGPANPRTIPGEPQIVS